MDIAAILDLPGIPGQAYPVIQDTLESADTVAIVDSQVTVGIAVLE